MTCFKHLACCLVYSGNVKMVVALSTLSFLFVGNYPVQCSSSIIWETNFSSPNSSLRTLSLSLTLGKVVMCSCYMVSITKRTQYLPKILLLELSSLSIYYKSYFCLATRTRISLNAGFRFHLEYKAHSRPSVHPDSIRERMLVYRVCSRCLVQACFSDCILRKDK